MGPPKKEGGFSMWFRKKTVPRPFDPAVYTPVIRASICTGEKVAGFKHKQTGVFTGVRLLRSPQDLADFRATYHIEDGDIPTEY